MESNRAFREYLVINAVINAGFSVHIGIKYNQQFCSANIR